MRIRTLALRALLVIIGLPIVALTILVISFYALLYFPNRTTATDGVLVSSGVKREYLVYVPATYNGTTPVPLVISMHPAMSWPAAQMNFSHWNDVADEHGFIVAYPAGIGFSPKTWFMRGRETPARMPDVIFISELIDTLSRKYRIDAKRIFADGMSNGGGMAFALSCTLSDRIAAVGMVSAARSLDWNWCTDDRPVPAVTFHGTADPVVPYEGGRTPVGPDVFPSVPSFTANWARRNRCGANPIESTPAQDVVRWEYTGCADSASVVLYTIVGGGHQWPGGRPLPAFLVGPYSRSIDATRVMWTFFAAHPLVTR